MRIKLIKDYKGYDRGDVIAVKERLGQKLIKTGYAILSKDMTPGDYSVSQYEVKHG